MKKNIAEILDTELSSPSWKGDIINIGCVCDSYQSVERKYGLMQDVLKVMIKHKNPVIISIKSDLILRDIELIDKLAHTGIVQLIVTKNSTKCLYISFQALFKRKNHCNYCFSFIFLGFGSLKKRGGVFRPNSLNKFFCSVERGLDS